MSDKEEIITSAACACIYTYQSVNIAFRVRMHARTVPPPLPAANFNLAGRKYGERGATIIIPRGSYARRALRPKLADNAI